jgi:hypothetical protein
MKSHLYLPAFLLALLLTGCQSPQPAAGGSGAASSSTSTKPDSTQSPSTTASETQKPPPPVPDELKNDAFHWYGLSLEKPMEIEVALQGGVTYTGYQTVRLKSVENGKAIYDIERTGDLGSQIGQDTVSLEKGGLYTVSSTRLGKTRNIEMPAKLEPGATWKNTGKLESNDGRKLEQDITYRVIGPAKVTTKAGAQDAMLIKASGNIKGDKLLRMESSMWYVKDKGLVKSVFTLRDVKHPKEKPQVITFQEVKP